MNNTLEVKKTLTINAETAKIWDAITNPDKIKIYFFGTEVLTDWKTGSTLTFQGEFNGQKYKDKGNILAVEPGSFLQYNYWSSFSGLEDIPANYSIVTYKLKNDKKHTILTLTQKGFANEQALEHANSGWEMILQKMKEMVENE